MCILQDHETCCLCPKLEVRASAREKWMVATSMWHPLHYVKLRLVSYRYVDIIAEAFVPFWHAMLWLHAVVNMLVGHMHVDSSDPFTCSPNLIRIWCKSHTLDTAPQDSIALFSNVSWLTRVQRMFYCFWNRIFSSVMRGKVYVVRTSHVERRTTYFLASQCEAYLASQCDAYLLSHLSWRHDSWYVL